MEQAPVPSQTRHRPHSASGSVLVEWFVQVPTKPGRLHARQAPEQSVPQQTPSWQNPLWHSFVPPQAWPSAFLATQVFEAEQ
jgi:hypothetical protein